MAIAEWSRRAAFSIHRNTSTIEFSNPNLKSAVCVAVEHFCFQCHRGDAVAVLIRYSFIRLTLCVVAVVDDYSYSALAHTSFGRLCS